MSHNPEEQLGNRPTPVGAADIRYSPREEQLVSPPPPDPGPPPSAPVLDHGYVILRNISGPTRRPTAPFDGTDLDPANSARMSFGQTDSGRTEQQDLRLADYLYRNRHTTPFEMVELWFEMKLPIFLARQFVRHRTATINEISGRYVTLPSEWYIPEKVGAHADDVKQGQVDTLPEADQQWYQQTLDRQCAASYDHYMEAIHRGVAHEHARLLLHLNHYTRWLWKQDLHNLMHFLRLRSEVHAQVEARAYAQAMSTLLQQYLPHSMELMVRYSC